MKCPRCESVDLKTKILEKVQVDECPECKGIWFDKDELRQSKDNFDGDLNWMDFDIWQHHEKFKAEHSIKCPRCNKTMWNVDYDKSGVEIDYCAHCEGVWLDGGEFGKIIKYLEDSLLKMSTKEYLKASLKEAGDLFRMKEGFISEWKDFAHVLKLMNYRLFIEHPRLKKVVDEAKEIPIK